MRDFYRERVFRVFADDVTGREARPLQCRFGWPVKFQLFRLLHKIDSLLSIFQKNFRLSATASWSQRLFFSFWAWPLTQW